MHELISHPGLQFYVFQLSGKLTYTLCPTGRPPKTFELDESDFQDAEGAVKEEGSLTMEGTAASAVGLELELIKNIGHLQMKFEGSDGGSAAWEFDGLEELGKSGKMYAMAATQTCIATFAVTGVQATEEPMIDAQSAATMREKQLKITSIDCKDKDGILWKLSPGGNAKRVRDESEPKKEASVAASASEETQALRKRDKAQIPFASLARLPQYLLLLGTRKGGRYDSGRGVLALDHISPEIMFVSEKDEMPLELRALNTMTWGKCGTRWRLQLFHDGSRFFTSYHEQTCLDRIAGSDTSDGEPTHKVHLEDFLQTLRRCLASR